MNSTHQLRGHSEVWRFDNANALNYALIDAMSLAISKVTGEGRNPVIALPTGNTMIPFYRIAVESAESLQIEKWRCFNLDEYYPLTPENEKLGFRAYMNSNFFSRLKQTPLEQQFLNGSAADRDVECTQYEQKIKASGGLDIALLGIGTNGHIAFNEPGSEFDTRTRAVELHPQTLMANFKGTAPFTHALTMGIGTLLEAKKIFVVALGKNKAPAVRAALQDRTTRTLPATALQEHGDVTWLLDQEAASML